MSYLEIVIFDLGREGQIKSQALSCFSPESLIAMVPKVKSIGLKKICNRYVILQCSPSDTVKFFKSLIHLFLLYFLTDLL